MNGSVMMWFSNVAHIWATKVNDNKPGKAELLNDLDVMCMTYHFCVIHQLTESDRCLNSFLVIRNKGSPTTVDRALETSKMMIFNY